MVDEICNSEFVSDTDVILKYQYLPNYMDKTFDLPNMFTQMC